MLAQRLIDGLYTEAMLLADEARGYFDDSGASGRGELAPLDRVVFSCESLKVTTRLMHVIAWLLTQRAVEAGEIAPDDARSPARRLGGAVASEEATLARMPADARTLIEGSIELYRRVERLDAGTRDDSVAPSPARHLLHRLERAF
ncbi:MAG: DUF1465 family protein [Sphingomonadaceae bacterium]|nr:DUF1465 family protein [Sphingomonadaceae bacterium]